MPVERERLDADVLIVGAGPAGLACALHLSRLIAQHNAAGAKPELSAENIYVLEKGREIGAHQLSGAVMDPRGLAELVPDWEKTAPLESPVIDDAAFVLTSSSAWKLPITPPPLRNHGNYIVSVNKLVKWLGGLVEQAGVNLFTQFAGAHLIYEGGGIAGVITDDKGVDKDGKPKDNYTPGYELRAKVTVLAEGPRGSLTKDMVNRLKLDGLNPQVYGIGIKELWEVPAGRIKTGYVAHTLGWPLDSSMYGGGWLYGLPENRVSLGMVIGPRVSQSAFRSARSVSEIQDASVPQARSRRRQAGALRREDGSLRRLVFHAAHLRGRRADHRRFGQPAQFAAPQGHPHGDQERDARRGDGLRSAQNGRRIVENALGVSAQDRAKLDQERVVGGAKFSSGIPARPLRRPVSCRNSVRDGRARADRSHALAPRTRRIPEARTVQVPRPSDSRATAR